MNIEEIVAHYDPERQRWRVVCEDAGRHADLRGRLGTLWLGAFAVFAGDGSEPGSGRALFQVQEQQIEKDKLVLRSASTRWVFRVVERPKALRA